MSTSKSTGASRLGRDSRSQRLGIKIYAGETANTGNIIIRQRGAKYLAGKNVRKGADDTLYAAITGKVSFSTKLKKVFDGSKRRVKVVSVQ